MCLVVTGRLWVGPGEQQAIGGMIAEGENLRNSVSPKAIENNGGCQCGAQLRVRWDTGCTIRTIYRAY